VSGLGWAPGAGEGGGGFAPGAVTRLARCRAGFGVGGRRGGVRTPTGYRSPAGQGPGLAPSSRGEPVRVGAHAGARGERDGARTPAHRPSSGPGRALRTRRVPRARPGQCRQAPWGWPGRYWGLGDSPRHTARTGTPQTPVSGRPRRRDSHLAPGSAGRAAWLRHHQGATGAGATQAVSTGAGAAQSGLRNGTLVGLERTVGQERTVGGRATGTRPGTAVTGPDPEQAPGTPVPATPHPAPRTPHPAPTPRQATKQPTSLPR